jgi:hypothetical protein
MTNKKAGNGEAIQERVKGERPSRWAEPFYLPNYPFSTQLSFKDSRLIITTMPFIFSAQVMHSKGENNYFVIAGP